MSPASRFVVPVLYMLSACGGDGSNVGGAKVDDPPGDVDGGIVDAAAGPACETTRIPSSADFIDTVVLSNPTRRAFSPSLSSRGDDLLVAWREADSESSLLQYAIVRDGCMDIPETIEDPLPGARRPVTAATASGWVMAYQVDIDDAFAIRAVWLDADGEVVMGPETISGEDVAGAIPSISAHGDDVVFAWSSGIAHHFARRGPVENIGPLPVGTVLEAPGLINTVHIAVVASGDVFVAYSDGGPESYNRDILLVRRPVGGEFGAPVNVSKTPSLMSTDLDMVADGDALNMVWVEQDGDIVEHFEVHHARRDAEGKMSPSARYGDQHAGTWSPDAIAGGGAAWHLGGISAGVMYVSDGDGGPVSVGGDHYGGGVSLVQFASSELALAFVEPTSPPQLRLGLGDVSRP